MNLLPLCASTFTRRASSPCLLLAILAAAVAPLLSAQPLDAAFNPGVNADIFGLAAQPDGKILVGGNFTTIGGISRSRVARLNPDGSLDAAFNPSIIGTAIGTQQNVQTIALQPEIPW